MQDILKNKNFLIGGGIAVALIAVYFIFFYGKGSVAPEAGSDVLTESYVNPIDLIVGRDLLLALSKMKSTKLDTSFLSDSAFLSLKDFSVEIAKEDVGRKNPFAPLPGTVSSTQNRAVPAR